MERLFLVTFIDYKRYYVTAKDFNQAAIKAKEQQTQEHKKEMINSEGDLCKNTFPAEIDTIQYLTDRIL